MLKSKKRFVIDLDGTLCSQEHRSMYHLAKPFHEMIKRINDLYGYGHEIVIYTARGMVSCNGQLDLIESRFRSMTEEWLKDNNVLYHSLVFGKLNADVYVDDKSTCPRDFLHWSTLWLK